MRDEERIEMYYKFGLLDWRNEKQLQNEKSSRIFDLSVANFERFLSEIAKALRIRTRI